MKRTLASLTAVLLSTSSLYSAALLPNGQQQFVDGNGKPYASGTVTFYSNYPTCSVLKNTWSNSGQTVLNTNPIVLDSAGRATIFGSGSYCQVLKDSSGNTIWTKETADPSGTSNLGWGGTSGGTANAQTVTVSGFSSTNGQTFYFVAGYTNTSSMTISVNGGAALSVLKDTPTGSQFLTGGEVVAGNVTGVTYVSSTGTLHLITNTSTTPSGQLSGFAMNSCPGGWVAADGSAVSRITYANLYSNIGTTWGSGDGSTTFNLPDFRGQFLRGYDSRVPGSGALDTTTFAGTTSSSSSPTTISGISSALTPYLFAGMPITGAGIPAGTTISTVSSTSITISASASASSTALTGTTTSGSYNVTSISSTAALAVGQTVTGTGIPSGTTIASIVSGTAILLSAPASATGTPTLTYQTTLTVGRTFAGAQDDQFETHTHPLGDPTHVHPSVVNYNNVGNTGSGTNNVIQGTTNTGVALTGNVNAYVGNAETRPKNYAVLYCVKY